MLLSIIVIISMIVIPAIIFSKDARKLFFFKRHENNTTPPVSNVQHDANNVLTEDDMRDTVAHSFFVSLFKFQDVEQVYHHKTDLYNLKEMYDLWESGKELESIGLEGFKHDWSDYEKLVLDVLACFDFGDKYLYGIDDEDAEQLCQKYQIRLFFYETYGDTPTTIHHSTKTGAFFVPKVFLEKLKMTPSIFIFYIQQHNLSNSNI